MFWSSIGCLPVFRLFKRMEALGVEAMRVYNQPDFGPRGRKIAPQVHTYSSIMCWAACDRLGNKIAEFLEFFLIQKYSQNSSTIEHRRESKVLEE